MKVLREIKKMQGISAVLRGKGKEIGFVPTMGALHEGHLSLVRKARRENDYVVVSIFVNPAQFGPKEDFKNYPRNLKKDAILLKKQDIDFIFYPDARDVYPPDYRTYIDVKGLDNVLCGKFRPGHFRGVATVVAKLFNIVQPNRAYFGQKDAQQAVIIKKMVRDLNIPIQIRVLPTVREDYGLAMSSRNNYLGPAERSRALVLSQALKMARDLIKEGNYSSSSVIRKMRQLIEQKRGVRIQYICVVDPEKLEPVIKIKDKVLIALAVYIGETRLIDNIVFYTRHA